MATGNFYSTSGKYFIVPLAGEDEDFFIDTIVDDVLSNVKNDLKKALPQEDMYDMDESDNNRNFPGIIFEEIDNGFETNYEGDEYNVSVEIDCIIRSGYYEGLNLDYEIYADDKEITDIKDFEGVCSPDTAKNIKNWLDEITQVINQVYSKYTDKYEIGAQFSNGETIYKKAD